MGHVYALLLSDLGLGDYLRKGIHPLCILWVCICRMFFPTCLPLLPDMLGGCLQYLAPLCKAYTCSVMNFPAKLQCWGKETYAQCGSAADGAHQDALEQLSKPS